MHEVLFNRLGGLSLPRKSVVRLTDRPNMTLDVYRGRETTIQQQLILLQKEYIVGVSELGFNVPPTTRSYGDGSQSEERRSVGSISKEYLKKK